MYSRFLILTLLLNSQFSHANIFKALLESCGLKKQSKARVADFQLESNPVAKTLDGEIFSSKWSNGIKWYNGIQANQGGVLSLRLPQREQSVEVDSFVQLLEDNFAKHASVSSVELIKDKDGYLTAQIKMKAKIRSAPDDILDSVTNILERTEFKEPGPGKSELIAEVNAKKEAAAKAIEDAKRSEEQRLEGLRKSEVVQSAQRMAGSKLVYSQEPISKQTSSSIGYNSGWSNGIRWSADRSDFVESAMIRLPHFDSSPAVTDLLEVFKRELAGEASIFSIQLIRNRDGLQTIQVRPKRDAERLSPAAQEKIANILSRVKFEN
jgi:predicted secreted protein